MKFQLGDRVLVLHSNEEGEVIDIINDQMVMVEVRGVRFPAYVDQLDFPYFKQFSAKKIVPDKKKKQFIEDVRREKEQPTRVADGAWLSFLPVFSSDEFGDEVVDDLKIHLVNNTGRTYLFIYRLRYAGQTEFELKNDIRPFSDFYIHDLPYENINDSPSFEFEFTLPEPEKNKVDFYEAKVKQKPRQVYQRVEQLKKEGAATFTYKLFDSYPDKEQEIFDFSKLHAKGLKVYSLKEARQKLPIPRTVIDLHIEKLTDDWKRLSNAEILDIQLKEFEKWYEITVAHRQDQLIVIHGIGKGKLRDEIHDLLRLKKEVRTFVNQYHPSFGYGATEIYFEYR